MTTGICGYYGGKRLQLGWLLPLLPETYAYLEPFSGMGSVYLNRRPMSKRNILNDRDENIANLFRILRDRPDELKERIELTPAHRREFADCKKYLMREKKDPLEWARAALVVVAMGMIHTTRFDEVGPDVSPNNYVVGRMEGNRMNRISTRIREVSEILNHESLTYESTDAVKFIRWYLKGAYIKDTLIYVDPPYVYSERYDRRKIYTHDSMTDDDHVEMLEVLKNCDVKVAISGYPSKLYDQQLKDWWRDSTDALCITNGKRTERTEVLWRNYDLSQDQWSQQNLL